MLAALNLALLLKNHGVFTAGKPAKTAVIVEDIAKLHYRYTHIYGQ